MSSWLNIWFRDLEFGICILFNRYEASRDDVEMLVRYMYSIEAVTPGQVDFVCLSAFSDQHGARFREFCEWQFTEKKGRNRIVHLLADLVVHPVDFGDVDEQVWFHNGKSTYKLLYGFFDRFQAAMVRSPEVIGEGLGHIPWSLSHVEPLISVWTCELRRMLKTERVRYSVPPFPWFERNGHRRGTTGESSVSQTLTRAFGTSIHVEERVEKLGSVISTSSPSDYLSSCSQEQECSTLLSVENLALTVGISAEESNLQFSDESIEESFSEDTRVASDPIAFLSSSETGTSPAYLMVRVVGETEDNTLNAHSNPLLSPSALPERNINEEFSENLYMPCRTFLLPDLPCGAATVESSPPITNLNNKARHLVTAKRLPKPTPPREWRPKPFSGRSTVGTPSTSSGLREGLTKFQPHIQEQGTSKQLMEPLRDKSENSTSASVSLSGSVWEDSVHPSQATSSEGSIWFETERKALWEANTQIFREMELREVERTRNQELIWRKQEEWLRGLICELKLSLGQQIRELLPSTTIRELFDEKLKVMEAMKQLMDLNQ